METDGANDTRIKLFTSYDYGNTLRETQWAFISIFKPLAGNANTDRIISMETADGVGYYWTQTGTGTHNVAWSGTTPIDLDGTAVEGTLHNIINVSDIAANDSWLTVDGADADLQADAATLDVIDAIAIALGARLDADDDGYAGVYGAQYFLDLTGTTVDVAFKTGLSQAINNAAYNAADIASAIRSYDSNIVGVYWALNELLTGDASDHYILAKDLTGIEQTSEFYGFVSSSGVVGTRIDGIGVNPLQGLIS